jgi:hypothetical protein
MPKSIKEFYGSKLAGLDGDIGHVKDFYFDDKTWVIRYVVVDTGSWLSKRLVLLSPHSIGRLEEVAKTVLVNLTRKQIEDSPSIDSHIPVSRQHEIKYYHYYGLPAYWHGNWRWGMRSYPVLLPSAKEETAGEPQYQHRDSNHLRSTRAVAGYSVETSDGKIGRLGGFRVDGDSWAITEVIVEVGELLATREVPISPDKIEGISAQEEKVLVNLNLAEIRRSAEAQIARVHPENLGAKNVRG